MIPFRVAQKGGKLARNGNHFLDVPGANEQMEDQPRIGIGVAPFGVGVKC